MGRGSRKENLLYGQSKVRNQNHQEKNRRRIAIEAWEQGHDYLPLVNFCDKYQIRSDDTQMVGVHKMVVKQIDGEMQALPKPARPDDLATLTSCALLLLKGVSSEVAQSTAYRHLLGQRIKLDLEQGELGKQLRTAVDDFMQASGASYHRYPYTLRKEEKRHLLTSGGEPIKTLCGKPGVTAEEIKQFHSTNLARQLKADCGDCFSKAHDNPDLARWHQEDAEEQYLYLIEDIATGCSLPMADHFTENEAMTEGDFFTLLKEQATEDLASYVVVVNDDLKNFSAASLTKFFAGESQELPEGFQTAVSGAAIF